jgi:hypothetical protein
MSTEAQIAANQANAQHSTGPQSAAGKAASSQNRRLHGLALSGLRVTRPKRGLKLPRTGLERSRSGRRCAWAFALEQVKKG